MTDDSAAVSQTDIQAAGPKHGSGAGAGAASKRNVPGELCNFLIVKNKVIVKKKVDAASKREVHVALLNFRSLNNKVKDMKDFIKGKKLDVFLITETWLKPKNESQLTDASEKFKVFHNMRTEKGGGGVAIVVLRDGMGDMKRVNFENFHPTTFEHVASNLKHSTWEQHVLFITVYRPPESSVATDPTISKYKKFRKDFEELLTKAEEKNNRIIVNGDFNLWLESDTNSKASNFKKLLNEKGFEEKVKGVTNKYGHTLDQVFSKKVTIVVKSIETLPKELTDHCMICFDVL